MTSADTTAAAPDAAGPSPARRGPVARGFTLLEVMLAFAIMAISLAFLTEAASNSFTKGVAAIDLRDLRVMADTVFRRVVYEHWKWNDGDTGTADVWYAEFAGLKGSLRDRWKIYRLVLHKRKGMVAGNDPSGRIENLFSNGEYSTSATGKSSTGGSSTGSGGSSGSGSGSSSGTGADAATGEPAYLLTLEVFVQDDEEPRLTLRSVIPVPESEREEDAK